MKQLYLGMKSTATPPLCRMKATEYGWSKLNICDELQGIVIGCLLLYNIWSYIINITKAPYFACHPKCLLVLQHSQQICNTLFLFLNISNRNVKRRFRSVDTVVENFARCQTKIIGACMYHWTSCTFKSCAWIELPSTSCYVKDNNTGACNQFQTKIWKRR